MSKELKMKMKGVEAGGSVSQISYENNVDQEMENIRAAGEAKQVSGKKPETSILRLKNFGTARGKWAVIVIGVLFVIFLVWYKSLAVSQ